MKTALYQRHVDLGAKMINFQGWEMPLHYKGIIAEHKSVRETAGVFDVSHMGKILISGSEAEKFLDYLCTNKIAGRPPFSATYAVLTNFEGRSVDDVIVFKENEKSFFVVVNASNRLKSLNHLLNQSKAFDVAVADCFEDFGILAIQGPFAASLMSTIFPEAKTLSPMTFSFVHYEGKTCILSATGYTGSGGFEFYGPNSAIKALFDRVIEAGAAPAGLGARDTLRLEMGYALYGHELDETIAPTESVSRWTVKWDKENFLGKEALKALEEKRRSQHGAVLLDPGVARSGCLVFQDGQEIGVVTSGTHAPSLNRSICIVMCCKRLKKEDVIEIKVRDKLLKARCSALPFAV